MLTGTFSKLKVHGVVTSSLADQHFVLFLQLVTVQVTSLPLGFTTGLGLGLGMRILECLFLVTGAERQTLPDLFL